jgi:hypothetical protein
MQGLKTTLNMGERQMSQISDLPGGIRVGSTMDGVHYILPPRDLGGARKIGIALIIAGLIVTVFMIFWMSGLLNFSSGGKGDGILKLFSMGMGLMGLPGLIAGIGIIVLGLIISTNMGHSEILVSREKITLIECVGPFKFRFKRDISMIDRFVVDDATPKTRTSDGSWKTMGQGQWSVIRVEGKSGRPMLVAMAYPREMVKALADNLTATVAALSHRPGTFAVLEEKKIPVVDESGGAVPVDVPVAKPVDSRATVRELENGFAIVMPPAGLLKGSKGLLFFSLVWNGFMATITSVMLFADKTEKVPVPAILFIAAFWAVGVGVLLGAINMGKRQTIIAVVAGTFGVKTTGLFGTKEIKLKIDEIGSVRMGASGGEINDKPIMELQVLDKDGRKKAGVLSERKEDELLWIAWLIRNKLAIPKEFKKAGF